MWWQQRLPGKGLAWAMETLSMFFPQEPFQSGSAVKTFGFSCLFLEGCSPGTRLLGIAMFWSSPTPSNICFVLPPPSGIFLCVYLSFFCPPLLF